MLEPLTKLSKILILVIMISWIMGAFTLQQAYKDKAKIAKYYTEKHELIQSENLQLIRELGRSKQQRDSLALYIVSLNIRDSIHIRRIAELEVEKTKIPKRYINKTNKELGELMDKRAGEAKDK